VPDEKYLSLTYQDSKSAQHWMVLAVVFIVLTAFFMLMWLLNGFSAD